MSQHVAGAGSRSLVYERGARAKGWRVHVAVALVLTVVAFAVHAGVASARTQIVSDDPQQQQFFQGWIDNSLMPSADAQVKVTGTICPGGQYMACVLFPNNSAVIAYPDVRYLYEAPYTQNVIDQTRAHLEFMHEVGHVFDWSQARASGLLRSRFLRVMHITGSGVSDSHWMVGQLGNMTVNPAELFAMAYSYCSVYPTLPSAVLQTVYWGYGYNPSPSQYTRNCTLIKRGGMVAPAGIARARR